MPQLRGGEGRRELDAIWITEVWDSKESHEASLTLPALRAAIERAMPLITEFGEGIVTKPVGATSLTVNAAPKAKQEREAARRLAQLGGTEPELEGLPRRRLDPE